MKYISIAVLCFLILHPALCNAAERVDLSSPQSTYDTCYSTLDFSSDKKELKRKIEQCLTPVAQKAVVSYAVLGAYFIDSLKNIRGQKKYPHFIEQVNTILENHNLASGSRKAFQKADLADVLADILTVYSTNPCTSEKLAYS